MKGLKAQSLKSILVLPPKIFGPLKKRVIFDKKSTNDISAYENIHMRLPRYKWMMSQWHVIPVLWLNCLRRQFRHLCILVSLYLCIFVFLFVSLSCSIFASLYPCICICFYPCIFVWFYLCIFVSLYLCISVFLYTFIFQWLSIFHCIYNILFHFINL